MAEVTIKAGAKLDVLTKKELDDALKHAQTNWMREVARGIKYRRFSAFGTADGAGAIQFGGASADNRLGPDQGFVWLIKRVSITGYDPATQSLALYNGSASSSAAIIPDLAVYQELEEILFPGEGLVVAGTVAANAQVWITGSCREAPESLAWKL